MCILIAFKNCKFNGIKSERQNFFLSNIKVENFYGMITSGACNAKLIKIHAIDSFSIMNIERVYAISPLEKK